MTDESVVEISGVDGKNPRRQILVLHGGGYRGLYTAAVLEELQKEARQPIQKAFHMIAGTSIGGIMALALAEGVKPGELREVIEREGKTLFPSYGVIGRIGKFMKRLFRAPHDQTRLRRLIESVLKSGRCLEDLKVNVVIPACDFTGGPDGPQPVIYTNVDGRLKTTKLIDVALATSAAPTYFQSHQMPESSSQLVDGGVIANSPSWIALTKAITEFGWHSDYIRMLVIGTTSSPEGRVPKVAPTTKWRRLRAKLGGGEGFLYWLRKGRLLSLLMNGQQRLADEMCRQALEVGSFFSINSFRSAEQDKVASSLDQASPEATNTLKQLATVAASEAAGNPEIMQILNYKIS